ncbi:hypothetical protein HMPREF1546_03498 [Oscillibacter sp. KLE 1745]|nr:hypothetical protein HMPREF1546_03498 [Oscillibacter sp. KLE 1745]
MGEPFYCSPSFFTLYKLSGCFSSFGVVRLNSHLCVDGGTFSWY